MGGYRSFSPFNTSDHLPEGAMACAIHLVNNLGCAGQVYCDVRHRRVELPRLGL